MVQSGVACLGDQLSSTELSLSMVAVIWKVFVSFLESVV